MAKSLFKACKTVIRDGISGTQEIGGYNVFIEYYTQEDIDNRVSLGNSIEDNVVLVADDTIEIPSGYTLTPAHPKKSLVIMCNTFVNNGTISMTAKAPYTLPHDWFILGKADNFSDNIVIPAYANNQAGSVQTIVCNSSTNGSNGINGNNGTNHQCGSGGTGGCHYRFANGKNPTRYFYTGKSGSGYAFGGGAGNQGLSPYDTWDNTDGYPSDPKSVTTWPYWAQATINPTYPMLGVDSWPCNWNFTSAGFGHPGTKGYLVSHIFEGNTDYAINTTNTGCGGRIIIYCKEFNNNGTIEAKGTNSLVEVQTFGGSLTRSGGYGGASGGGAIDVFYTELNTKGSLNVNGGTGHAQTVGQISSYIRYASGSGGNGCVTFSEWEMPNAFKPKQKYMSKDNMIYFLGQLVERLGE